MTADVEDGVNTITNGYDIGGRLLSIDAPGTANDATFAIDALGRFKSRTILGATDTYSYLGTSETVTRIVNAASADSLVDAGGGRLGVKVGTSVNWFLPDPHGNVAGSLSGTIVANALRYDAYGQTLTTGSAGGTQVATGYWKHQARLDISPPGLAQPLYEAGARLYSPGLGTFTSLDTFAGTSQDPLSLNRYLYAEANPATLVDPTGHFVSAGDSTPGSSCKFIGDWGCGQTAPTSKSEVRAAAPKPTKKKGADHGNGHGATWRDKGDEKHTPWAPPTLDAWMNVTDWQRDWYSSTYWGEASGWSGWGDNDETVLAYWILAAGIGGDQLKPLDEIVDITRIVEVQNRIGNHPNGTSDTWGASLALVGIGRLGSPGGGKSGSAREPISMDEAISRGVEHVNGQGEMVRTRRGNYQFVGPEFINEKGQLQRNIARFDVANLKPGEAPHLNLEVQIGGVKQPGDPHTLIDPFSVRAGDFD